jgi:hypothetical protein
MARMLCLLPYHGLCGTVKFNDDAAVWKPACRRYRSERQFVVHKNRLGPRNLHRNVCVRDSTAVCLAVDALVMDIGGGVVDFNLSLMVWGFGCTVVTKRTAGPLPTILNSCSLLEFACES